MHTLLRFVTVVLVLTVAAVCVSLGRWQLGRWEQKKTENAALEQRMAAAPLVLDSVRGAEPAGKVRVRGRFDGNRHILLGPRSHDGSPGVYVVTPLVLEGDGGVVLVNRGWMYAADAHTAFPEDHPEPGVHDVTGITSAIARGAEGPPWTLREADSVEVWHARTLDRDSLAVRLPYAIADWSIRELPDAALPAVPQRLLPAAQNEMTHLSYAVQWFLFATIIVVGPLVVLYARRKRRGATAPDPEVSDR